MALKYYAEQNARASGRLIRAEINSSDWAGPQTFEKLFAEDGCSILTEGPGFRSVYKPILTTNAEIRLYDPDGSLASELDAATDFSHQMRIEAGGQTKFVGLIDPSPLDVTLNAWPGTVVFKAKDGLALLKDIPYLQDDGTYYEGEFQLTRRIAHVLGKLGLNLNFNVSTRLFTPAMTATPDPLAQLRTPTNSLTFIPPDRKGAYDCETVLKSILIAFGAFIRQSQGEWWIVQKDLLFGGDLLFHKYGPLGGSLSSFEIDPEVLLVNTPDDERNIMDRDSRISNMIALNMVQMTYVRDETAPIIRNGTFEDIENVRSTTPRGDIGRGNTIIRSEGEATVRNRYWIDEGGDNNFLIDLKGGPDGEGNAVVLDAFKDKDFEWHDPASALDGTYQSVFRKQAGLTVRGGTGRQLRTEIWGFLDAYSRPENNIWSYPTYYRIKATERDTNEIKYLDVEGAWHDTETLITFGYGFGIGHDPITGEQVYVYGLPVERWVQQVVLSNDIPDGLWQIEMTLFRPIDVIPTYPQSGENGTIRQAKFGRIAVDYVIDGETGHSADVVIAHNIEDGQTLREEWETMLGDPPIVGMRGGLVAGDSRTPTSDWKDGPYSGQEPSGDSLLKKVAEDLLQAQFEHVPVRHVGYSNPPITFDPHHLPHIHGDRYQVGDFDFQLLNDRYVGDLIQIRKNGTPNFITQHDRQVFANLPSGQSDVAFLTAVSGSIFNQLSQGMLARTTELIDQPFDGTVAVEEVIAPIEANDLLLLVAPNGNFWDIRATENRNEGALDVAFEYDDGTPFDGVVPYPATFHARTDQLKALLILVRDAFRVTIRSDYIGELASDVILTGTETNPVLPIAAPGTTVGIADGQTIVVIDDRSAGAYPVVVDNDGLRVAEGVLEIPIAEGSIVNAPEGAAVKLHLGQMQSDILQNADEILLRATNERVIETIIQAGLPKYFSKVTTPISNGTTLPIEPAPYALQAGSTIRLLYQRITPENKFEPVVLTEERILALPVAASAETMEITAPITMPFAGALVYIPDTEIITRTEVLEGRVTVNESAVSAAVLRYESEKIAEFAVAYEAESRSTVSIQNLTRDIKKGDKFIAAHMASGTITVLFADDDLDAQAGPVDLPIQTTTVTADIGDPVVPGAMSELRVTLEGITVQAPFLGTTSWNGTVDEFGNILGFATQASWIMTAQGHFQWTDGTNSFQWNGSDFQFKIGDNGAISIGPDHIILDNDGIRFDAADLSTWLTAQNQRFLRWLVANVEGMRIGPIVEQIAAQMELLGYELVVNEKFIIEAADYLALHAPVVQVHSPLGLNDQITHPSNTPDQLYNLDGDLYWSGEQITGKVIWRTEIALPSPATSFEVIPDLPAHATLLDAAISITPRSPLGNATQFYIDRSSITDTSFDLKIDQDAGQITYFEVVVIWPAPFPREKLAAPVLSVKDVGTSSVTLGWTPVAGAQQYWIAWGTTDGGPYTEGEVVQDGALADPSDPEWVIDNLLPQTYYFVVAAYTP